MEVVSLREFARRHKVSLKTVQNWIAKGIINKTANGKIDVSEADYLLSRRQDPGKIKINPDRERGESSAPADGERKSAAPGDHDYWKSRAKRERYEAELAKLKYETEVGTLVNKDKIEHDAFEEGRTLRDRILIIPDRIDAILAAETDAKKVNKILTDELKAALRGIAETPIPSE